MPLYSYRDLEKHNTRDSLWILIHGKIYDITNFDDVLYFYYFILI